MRSPHVRTRKIVENSRIAGLGRGLNAHRLVAETAVGMANEAFEVYMSAHNEVYRAFKANLTDKQARAVFVSKVAPIMLEEARIVLTDLLAQPDDVCCVQMKNEIADALIKDSDFRANRSVAAANATALKVIV